MLTYEALQNQTLIFRERINDLLGAFAGHEDEIPPTWHNNARWHAGHLVVTPRLISLALAGEPLGIDENYRKWFAKGTSPADWNGASLPSFEQLRAQVVNDVRKVFEHFAPRHDAPFPQAYKTVAGVILHTPAEALTFSQAHDGIHLGMLMALKRAAGI